MSLPATPVSLTGIRANLNKFPMVDQMWFSGLPGFLQSAIDLTLAYTNRDLAVFFRTYNGTLNLMFRSVPDRLREQAAAVSSLGVSIDIFLDDLADKDARSDLIDEAQAYMFGSQPIADPLLEALGIMWPEYLDQISNSPRFSDFQTVLMHEWQNLLEALRYSIIINTDLANNHNFPDALRICGANMHHVVKHIVDMCFSPDWQSADTGPALLLAQKGQHVTRIGNWLKSWQQEYRLHRDISSGIFALASDWGLYTKSDLLSPSADTESIIKVIESYRHEESERSITAVEFLLDYAEKIITGIQGDYANAAFIDSRHYAEMLNLVIQQQKAGANESR